MKKIILGLLIGVALVGSPVRAFVYDNPFELQSDGDFDGDGRRDLIILDKASGAYRIGYQLSPGNYTWVAARASGIANATSLGIGKINALGFDSLAVTGPDANRINLLDANIPGTAGVPVSAFLPSLGPNMVTVMDIGGATNNPLDDLYVATLDNGILPYHQTMIRNGGGTNQTVLAENIIAFQRERGNPILLHTNRPARLGVIERNTGPSTDYLSIYDLSAGAASYVSAIALNRSPQPFEYVTGQFDPTTPYTEFLVYPPTGYYFYTYQVTEPSPGNYVLSYTNGFALTNFFDRLFVLPGTNGLQLLVLETNGVSATVYHFDGHNPPSPVAGFTPDAGEHFTGMGILGRGGFMAYSAPLGKNTSAKFKQWNWNGSGFSSSAAGTLPRVSPYSAGGNVMQFQFEPFVNSNPTLLRLNNAGDWSDAASFSGSPGNISVRAESFLSVTQGLGNPSVIVLGGAHPLATFGMANQYSNMISLFSFTPPAGDKVSDVTISPRPGLYPTAIALGFSAANAGDNIFFRVGATAWTQWSNGMTVRVFTNVTVQYYGQPTTGLVNAKSAIKSAVYKFTQGPATLDSNGDGVPDYVEIARGLNPNGGRDSDGDGYSNLEEWIHGTDPTTNASIPSAFPHLDDQAVFDLFTTPRPWDGFANASTLCPTGMVVRSYDLQGSLVGTAVANSNTAPVCWLTNVTIVQENRLITEATDTHFNVVTTNADPAIGREMIGLVAVPAPHLPSIPYIYGGGDLTTEANNWINSASNTLNHLPRTTLTNSLTLNKTTEALLFELKVAQLLGARGSNWWTNITLFPFRVSDAGRTNPSQATLLSLEMQTATQPAYKLLDMFGTISNRVENSLNAGIADLRQVVQDIYRIDSIYNNTNPATFASPVDEIRYFLWHGTLDSNYLATATTLGQLASASNGVVTILSDVLTRPTTNVLLVVRNDTLGGPCRLLDVYGRPGSFALVDSAGVPFTFPLSFTLLPGSILQVFGYTDLYSANCATPGIEVISSLLASVPIATDRDLDGNLLVDTWEQQFFGGLGIADPFGDADGDGYSNLQEMLEGSDPRDAFGRPWVTMVLFAPPVLNLVANAGMIEVHFQWPAMYVNRFNFGIRHTPDLASPFTDLPVSTPTSVGGNEFMITFAPPANPQQFYFLTLSLR